ncbi:MAG: hypothetical protein HYV07_14435 [Deltaproteobacteria bacterium]|nr:hypothetical protein [Deltaproteobacteria bacterium]
MDDRGSDHALRYVTIALVLSLLVIAFLGGRELGLREARNSCPPVPERLAEAPRNVEPPPATPDELEPARPVDRALSPSQLPDAVAMNEPPKPSTPRPARAPTRQGERGGLERDDDGNITIRIEGDGPRRSSGSPSAVREYLDRVAEIRVGPEGVAPNAFAESLMGANGGPELDKLAADLSRAEREVAELKPPPEAEAHHAKLKEVLARTRKLLIALKASMAQGDMSGMSGIVSDVSALQEESETLTKLEAELQLDND